MPEAIIYDAIRTPRGKAARRGLYDYGDDGRRIWPGLPEAVAAMDSLAERYGERYRPAAGLRAMADKGQSFWDQAPTLCSRGNGGTLKAAQAPGVLT